MDFYDVIKRRRSIRGYKSDPAPKDALERIAAAAQLAPSACNLQPWSFRVILDKELRNKICGVYTREWLAEAPAIIVALGNSDECWKRPDGSPIIDIDLGIAMEHVVLAAAAENLDTCWICAYDTKKMNAALNVLPPWSVLAISPLGYGNVPGREIPRKPINEIFRIVE